MFGDEMRPQYEKKSGKKGSNLKKAPTGGGLKTKAHMLARAIANEQGSYVFGVSASRSPYPKFAHLRQPQVPSLLGGNFEQDQAPEQTLEKEVDEETRLQYSLKRDSLRKHSQELVRPPKGALYMQQFYTGVLNEAEHRNPHDARLSTPEYNETVDSLLRL